MIAARTRSIVLWLAAAAAAAWFFTTDEPRGTVEAWMAERGISFSSPDIDPGLEIYDVSGVQPDFGRSLVRATLRNDTDRRFRVIRIRFELLDAQGKPIGRANAFLSEVAPGAVRAFEANAHGSAFSDVRLVEARGW